MDDKTKRDKFRKEVDDALMINQFAQDMGQKAIIERVDIQNEYMDKLREVLSDIGVDLQQTGNAPKGMNYVGALSVHVFKSEILNTAAFVILNNLNKLDPGLTDGALRELTGNTMVHFGKRAQARRSGAY